MTIIYWFVITIVVWCLSGLLTASFVDIISEKKIKFNFFGAYCVLGLIIPILLFIITIQNKFKKDEDKTGICK